MWKLSGERLQRVAGAIGGGRMAAREVEEEEAEDEGEEVTEGEEEEELDFNRSVAKLV